MRRDQLEHAILAACQIIGSDEVIVVGSQAILGSFDEDELPPAATMSLEIDVLPVADDNEETARLADVIEGVAGEFSPFEELHGFSIDGVDLTTSRPRVFPSDGATDSLGSRTSTLQRPARTTSSRAGAWTTKTCAWPSCAPTVKRTRTSLLHCSTQAS